LGISLFIARKEWEYSTMTYLSQLYEKFFIKGIRVHHNDPSGKFTRRSKISHSEDRY